MDLLELNTLNTAAGDTGWKNLSPGIRAVWTSPLDGEDGAPRNRIIHCRLMQLHAPARLHRMGLRPAVGYHKCGSRVQIDWVTAFRLLLWNGDGWYVHRDEKNLVRPANGETRWFDLGGMDASAAIIEVRRCEIDGWWTSWNLAQGSFILEGEPTDVPYTRKENRLTIEGIDLSGCPTDVQAMRRPGEVRYRTPFLEMGFWLGRAGFSHFALDEEGQGRTERNLLRTSPAVFLQGIRSHAVGVEPCVAPLLHNDVTGMVSVQGNSVRYAVALQNADQDYVLQWTILKDRVQFRWERQGGRDVRMWESAVWNIVGDSEVTPAAVLGNIVRVGETGCMNLPVLYHAPGHGTLRVSAMQDNAVCRSDSCRPLTYTSLELKVGEIPQTEGDYLLPVGQHILEGEMAIHRPPIQVQPSTPIRISRALERCSISSMTYRADTGTLSNNGNSIHAPLCMDLWSSVATRIGDLMPSLPAVKLLQDSVERWLDGGPGYASGGMTGENAVHLAEDEYIMTGTAGLLGVAEYLRHDGSASWLDAYAPQIERQLTLMRARDVDGDGIVESEYRHGMSGGHQWSTNWYDVVSFGWKDAFSNALLYPALVHFTQVLPLLGRPDLAVGIGEWAENLKRSYWTTFFNTKTGWLAGWRSKDGVLHDYAFLAVNGAAVMGGVVDGEHAVKIVRTLWSEAQRIGLPDPRLGLPGNLWPVADADMIALVHGKPMGHYINGGLTHSQSCRFVGALYKVGMTREGDSLLHALCESLADCTAFAGCNSGIDWRYWDGAPCGYEGILTDQFGVLAVALDRYGLRVGE